MTRPGNIEFLDADGPSPLDEDELSGGQGVPRWVAALGAVVLLAIAIAAVVANRGDHSRPAAVQSSVVTPQPTLTHPPAAGAVMPAGSVRLPGSTTAVDIAVTGEKLYVLQRDRITAVNAHTLVVDKSGAEPVAAQAGRDKVLADPERKRLWVVRTKDGSSVSAIDWNTLARTSTVSVGPDIPRAVVLDGRLYFSTSDGVYVADGRSVKRIHTFDAAVVIAADPLRHRLLVLVSGPGSAIGAMSTSGELGTLAANPVTAGNLAVVGSTIYVTGAAPRAAVVRTLDPVTLRAEADVDIADQLFPGANIAAIGAESLWLRSAGRNRDVLWCRDVTGGPLGSWWTLAGTIASAKGVAFVLDGTGFVRPINLFRGCAG